ncbi:MAG TPA: hypothetical protein VNO81_08055 [Candidatus Nitrosotenuis sp.]|jgi:hypothetical protein|nr:hypothetical protein [Candidatus Nitrosotenuis sp.]
MIAVGILATALLLVVGIFVNVSRASQKSIDLTAGTVIAESYIAKELYSILNDETKKEAFFAAGGDPKYNSRQTPFASGTARLNQTVFVYNLYASDISPSSSTYSEGNRMKMVDCVVWWWQEKGVEDSAEGGSGPTGSLRGSAEGYGFLRADVSRLVNEGSGF